MLREVALSGPSEGFAWREDATGHDVSGIIAPS